MATDPFAMLQAEPTPASAPQPGFFDGQLAAMPALPPTPQPVLTPVEPPTLQPPEIETAGIGAKILEAITMPGRDVKVRPPTLKKTTQVGPGAEIGEFVVIREAAPDEIDEFYTMTGHTRGAPSPTAAQREAGIPVTQFNLEKVLTPDDVKQVIDKTAEIWQAQGFGAGRGQMTHAEIKELGDAQGMGDVVDRLLRGKLQAKAEDIYAGLQAVTTSAIELNRLAKLATTTTDTAVLLRFRQHMAFHGALQAQMKGMQMEVARALGAFRIPRTGSPAGDANQIASLIQDYGGEKSVKEMAEAYLALPTQARRNQFTGGAWDKAKDAWFEVWINGLLSAPPTHMANMFGNMTFTLVRMAEKSVAGGIGAVRRMWGTEKPSIYASEVGAEALGFFQGMADGWALAKQAFTTEAPVRDLSGKILAAHRRSITSEKLAPETAPDFIKKGIDFLGVAARLPGRALMTEDEFFKGINYRMALNGLVTRRVNEMTMSGQWHPLVEDTSIRAAIREMLNNPPPDIASAAEHAAQVATFTDPVDGLLGKLGATAQHTLVGRMLLPFFKTPVNIAKAALERTPLGIAKLFKEADPIERDMIMARAGLGTMAMATAGYYYTEGRLTGSGPSNYTLRKQLEDIGWQRWSLTFPKEGVEQPRWLQAGHTFILHPDDVDYVSYHRLEPVSMILAMASDIAEQYRWPTASTEEGDKQIAKAAEVVFNYMKNQTFLQGFSTIADLFASSTDQAAGKATRTLQNLIGSQMPYSSALSMLERLTDPETESVIPDPNDPWYIRDIYAGLRRMETKTPFVDKTMPPIRDIFGTPRLQKGIRVVDSLLPPILADALGDDIDAIAADRVKLELVRIGLPLRPVQKRINDIPLTAEEYDDYVMYTAIPKSGISLYDALEQTIFDNGKFNEAYLEAGVKEQQDRVSAVYTLFKTAGKITLIGDPEFEEKYSGLRTKIREQQQMEQVFGSQVE